MVGATVHPTAKCFLAASEAKFRNVFFSIWVLASIPPVFVMTRNAEYLKTLRQASHVENTRPQYPISGLVHLNADLIQIVFENFSRTPYIYSRTYHNKI